jgi:predicted DNA-binding transcriptional regulator AlpA
MIEWRSDVLMKAFQDRLWTAEETAAYLQIPKATLYQWRYLGIGPKAGRVGRHLRYDPEDVKAWFRRQQGAA